MTFTVVGVLATELGHAMAGARAWSSPALEYRAAQPARVPIDFDHTADWCGEVVFLERYDRRLWCIGQVDGPPTTAVRLGAEVVEVETPLYWSAERVSTADDRDILLRSVALTAFPASVGATPTRWYEGDLAHRGQWHMDSTYVRGLVKRAGEAQHRRNGGPLTVHEHDWRDGVTDGRPLPGLDNAPPPGAGFVDERGRHVSGWRRGPASPILRVR